jgi:hypothetical protein
MTSKNLAKEKYVELLLAQYQSYVEMADRISARRVDASKFYSSLLTGLLAVIPFILGQNISPMVQKVTFLSMGVLGIMLCVIWVLNLNSYKQLNSLKFIVIHEIEEKLPFACYKREWEVLEQKSDSKGYLRLSKIEKFVPFLFIIPYIILVIYTLVV